jgi:Fur family peroxide stress response transcriptional regulator
MSHVEEVLRKSGLKMTHQRLEILREVFQAGNHPDAETVFRGVRERVPTVSLDTVYRTLWMLLDHGLISALGPSRERVRFDANTQSHHHFVCRQCGMICDFHSQELDGVQIPEAIRDLGQGEKIHIEVRGLCRDCLKDKASGC